jgi:branched-chain amino acid transport system substrate-binding protein
MMRHNNKPRCLLAVLATLVAVAACATARAEEAPLRIGVLTDMSGQYSDGNGPGAVAAARLAVRDFGGTVLGRRIEVIYADHQNKPDIGATIAREWLDTKGVDVIAEGVNSAVALAIQGVTRQRGKIFLISGSGSSDLTGKECSPTSVHWTYDTYASSNATARALLARGGDKWFFLTADYAFGQALQRDATHTLQTNGGRVVGSVAHPFGTTDYSSYLIQARASEANVVAFANAGSDLANSAKQSVEFGLPQSGKTLAALQVTITDVPAIGLQVMQGILFTESWYWDLDDQTRAFAARFEAERHAKPTAYQAGVMSSLTHYLKAVRAAGTTDAKAVMAKMRETPVDDFFAQGGRIRTDGRMVHDMYLMRFKKPEQSKGKWDLYELVATIKGDDAFRPLAEGKCPFATAPG